MYHFTNDEDSVNRFCSFSIKLISSRSHREVDLDDCAIIYQRICEDKALRNHLQENGFNHPVLSNFIHKKGVAIGLTKMDLGLNKGDWVALYYKACQVGLVGV